MLGQLFQTHKLIFLIYCTAEVINKKWMLCQSFFCCKPNSCWTRIRSTAIAFPNDSVHSEMTSFSQLCLLPSNCENTKNHCIITLCVCTEPLIHCVWFAKRPNSFFPIFIPLTYQKLCVHVVSAMEIELTTQHAECTNTQNTHNTFIHYETQDIKYYSISSPAA